MLKKQAVFYFSYDAGEFYPMNFGMGSAVLNYRGGDKVASAFPLSSTFEKKKGSDANAQGELKTPFINIAI